MTINCKKIADDILSELKQKMEELSAKGVKGKFAIILANESEASKKYVTRKIKKAFDLNIDVDLFEFKKIDQSELENLVEKINQDDSYHGLLIQLPVPKNININKVIMKIDPKKDIDGFVNGSNFLFTSNEKLTIPCTPLGIMKILEKTKVNLSGKHVVIINRSLIVGKPLIDLMLEKNATVTICHSKTKNIRKFTSEADVIIVGVGKANFLKKSMVNKKAIVIDVGINMLDGKLVGDCDFKRIKDHVKLITPVPGGVGQLTIAMFFYNLIELIKNIEVKKNERI